MISERGMVLQAVHADVQCIAQQITDILVLDAVACWAARMEDVSIQGYRLRALAKNITGQLVRHGVHLLDAHKPITYVLGLDPFNLLLTRGDVQLDRAIAISAETLVEAAAPLAETPQCTQRQKASPHTQRG